MRCGELRFMLFLVILYDVVTYFIV